MVSKLSWMAKIRLYPRESGVGWFFDHKADDRSVRSDGELGTGS